jgi:hypothetical protein
MLYEKGIRFDSSMCTRLGAGLKPLLMNSGLVRFPVFLEDGSYSEYAKDWTLESILPAINTPGLKIFNLHPVNVIMNIHKREYYDQIRETFNTLGWQDIDKESAERYAHRGHGPLNLIKQLLEYITRQKKQVASFRELCQQWQELT